MDKLENLLVRLESAVTTIELSAKGELVADNQAQVITALQKLITGFTKDFITLSVRVGTTVGKTTEIVCQALEIGLKLVTEIYNRLPLVESQINDFYTPLTSICKYPRPPLDHQDNFCKALEKIPDLFFFITDNRPTDWVKEAVSSVEFYNNRVITSKKHELSQEWSSKLTAFLKSIVSVIDTEFQNRKIRFVGSAGAQSLPVPQIHTSPDVQQQVQQKSQQPQQSKPKPPSNVFQEDRNLHAIDNQISGTIEIDGQFKHSVFISNCSNTNIIIKGKINSVTINQSSNTAVLLQSCISQVDIIRSDNIRVQVSSFSPTFNIENCDTIKLFLHQNCKDSEILTYYASGIKIIELVEVDGEFMGGENEVDLPSHFQHQWSGKGVKTQAVEACGE
ncbi:Adenylyl cyclase-associated protein [Spironucleus salmonicida]|uniref:Adenylyl cyclase-associated protein n=1 Tax=Spironucleus salmonicida TaxID=348837 RepID=V6LGF7_9EUKA|nr:Adenylyl cyclase-associated protein [Spironucleus salmonicida]|eukprot:EST43640.1 Adenylyl cyclase-associated protein [Spironucleus salmonicida]